MKNRMATGLGAMGELSDSDDVRELVLGMDVSWSRGEHGRRSGVALRGGDWQPGVDECVESCRTVMLKMAW